MNMKKICALGMAFVMAVTSVNLPVRAEGQTNEKASEIQIGDYYGVSQENGALPDIPTIKKGYTEVNKDAQGNLVDKDSARVSVNKTIEGTDAENVFEITLNVETNELIETHVVSPDAAVVLVVDVSASMQYCLEHGVTDGCNNERIDAALEAAQTFINKYAASANGQAQRKIAIAKFYKDTYTVTDWVEASTLATNDNSYSSVVSSLANDLSSHSGTNIEGGLLLARNMLTSEKIADIKNRTVILLSDGATNSSVISTAEAADYAINYGSTPSPTYDQADTSYTTSTTKAQFVGFYNNADYHFHHNGAKVAADEIKAGYETGMPVEFHTIYCGTASDDLTVHDNYTNDAYVDSSGKKGVLQSGENCEFCEAANEHWDTNKRTPDKKVTEFLDTISDKFVEAYDVEALLKAFENIEEQIQIATEAWQGSDPMGITGQFVEVTSSSTSDSADKEYEVIDNKISWDLLKAEPVISGTDNNKTYTYSMKYKVQLDTLSDTFVKDTFYPANNPTELKYYFKTTENGVVGSSELESIYFNVPSIKGYAGDYTFNKVDENGRPIKGAEFTLTTDDKLGWSMKSTSLEDGTVVFKDIPSGHTYTLTETKAPEGYFLSDETHELKVEWGVVTVDGVEGKVLEISNAPIPKTEIKASKVWDDTGAPEGMRPEEITVNLTGKIGDKVVVEKSQKIEASDDWEYTFTDLYVSDERGNKITYTVTEDTVPGYSSEVTGNEENGYVITNTYDPTINISGAKTWSGGNDWNRPSSITVRLYANGEEVDSKTVRSSDSWRWTFSDLPKYDAQGKEIIYTVLEDAVNNYYPSYDGYDITNTYLNNKTSVTVVKVWDDAADKDGIRPEKLSVKLTGTIQIGQRTETVVEETIDLSDDNAWKYVFSNLDKTVRRSGRYYTISYSVDEVSVPSGYVKQEITGSTEQGFIITNKHTPETTSVSGSKTWNDNNDQDGLRPDEITINLLANGQKVDSKTVTAKDNWRWSFTGLDKYKNGKEITYTITEEDVPGYTETVEGYNVINTHTPEVTSATVTKVWDDAENQDGKRPESLVVTLSNGQTVTLNEANNWTATLENLPKYTNGQEIVYTWTEGQLPEGYTLTKTEKEGTVTTLTNSYEPETTSATVTKVWNDANNQDGKRPESLTVTLSDGTEVVLNESNNWTATVEDLPKYENGQIVTYTWTEGEMPDGYVLTNTATEGTITTLTNSYTPETTSATVRKVWDDANNQDGKRPESLVVTLSNGQTVTLNEANNWTATIDGLPKYEKSQEITYTWTESQLPEGYTLTNTEKEGTVTTLTNSYTPEITKATIVKVWDDANNQDGKRPENLAVTLSDGTEVTLNEANDWTATVEDLPVYANGEKISYTWAEDTLPEGYTLTNTETYATVTVLTNSYTPELTSATIVKVWDDANNQDGKRPENLAVTLSDGTEVTLNEANDWTATVENLPKYADGQEIIYTWVEDEMPDGYALSGSAKEGTVTTLTNSRTPEVTSATVKKVWNDADNNDGKRPESLVVTLSNGIEVTLNEANGWEATVENLPKYEDGEEIEYIWTEGKMPEGYKLADTDRKGTVTTLTNGYTPEKTSATIKKVWDDAENQDGKRPENLTVTLSDGTEVTLNEANGWTATVEDLPKYENGEEISYTWTEGEMPEGYELTDTDRKGTVTTLTNSYTPEKTSATIEKVWNDADNNDGKRPETLTVTLSDGTEVTLNEANNWTATVENLPKYENGQEIIYTWEEAGMPAGYTLTDSSVDGTVTTLTNSYTPATVNATVKKVWDDAENQDGKRPESIIVTLSNGQSVMLNAENDWEATINGLPKYENGEEIVYTWEEASMPTGYTLTDSSVVGIVTTLTNSYTPETTSATIVKVWDDAGNQDGKRPESLVVTLNNGQTVTLNEANNWTATVENLPKYENGQEIIYTWTEESLPEGYTLKNAVREGEITTLTNSYTPELTEATVTKVWNDNDNADGNRPESLVVTLSNGQTVTLNAENKWTATIENLPKYADGQAIEYSWTEGAMPAGYALTDTSVDGTITTLTNGYTPELTSATVIKAWDDNNNNDGKRPENLKVTLSNGTEVTLNEANKWTATVENLPKYLNGEEVLYTWREEALPEGYALQNVSAEGTITTITNIYPVDEKTEATVTKVWDDADNNDGKRPEALTVTLSNGTAVTLNEENNWTATVEDLPKYKDGEEIEYTWTEGKMPDGYSLAKTEKDGTVTTLTNSYIPEETEATIVKVWDDAENQDGKRPENLTVTLSDGTEVTLNEANGWTATVENLPKYKDGEEIEYSWTEDEMPEGYTLTATGKNGTVTTLTNSYTPETTEATVVKVWDDDNNNDNKRPLAITVTLSNGTDVTLNEANNWTATVENLPKYAEGEVITYTWSEGTMPTGYKLTNVSVSGTVTTLTNSHENEETQASIRKVWNDNGNIDGNRPESLLVTLSDGTEVTLNEANNWMATVTGLPKYQDGEEIEYTWTEGTVPAGYSLTSTSVEGTVTTFTNSYEPVMTSATVKKVWDDDNNNDGKRPVNLVVVLSDGTEVTLNAANNWTATVENLPKYKNGQEVSYTWSEGKLPEGYGIESVERNGTVTTITNKYPVNETTQATVKKVWHDEDNNDRKRPESLTVVLSNGAEVTLNETNKWTATVTGLPKYEDGKEIQYSWTEGEMPEGYKLRSIHEDGIVTTLHNSYEPETTEASIIKVWDDAENQDGKRPETLIVTLSNGTEVTLTEKNNWSATVENLPKYKDGELIGYTWEEVNLPEGYILTNTNVNGTVTTLTNSHEPEMTETTVKKVWDDDNNNDGKRPESLTVTLNNGQTVTLTEENGWSATIENLPKYENGKEITYVWTETNVPDGYVLTDTSVEGKVTTFTNHHEPETTEATVKKVWDDNENADGNRPESLTVTLSNGETVILNESNDWTATIKNLPKYEDGQEIAYTWTEGELPIGYALTGTSVDGTVTTLTNTYTRVTTEVTVIKVWNDFENNDGKRPQNLKVTLSNGTEVTLNEANSWTATVTDLPKYLNGEEVVYTWSEEALPEGYGMQNTVVDGTVTTITNIYPVEEKTEATVKKVWDDAENQDGKRPQNLKVTLSNGAEVTLNEENNWTATIVDLPKYEDGQEIPYTWTENQMPEGYKLTGTDVEGTITTLTNSHTPEETKATVRKVWDDADDQDGKRPESLDVTLSNGTEVTLNAENDWQATVNNLPKYEDGKLVEYSWSEGRMPKGYTLTDTSINGTVTTITNSYVPETTEVSISKVWDDAENQDGKRPATLTVRLNNGQSVVLSEANDWFATIQGLPKYEKGEEIEYSWEEVTMPDGYELTDISKKGTVTTLTNSYTPEMTEATIQKVWSDAENQDGKRPESLTVVLSDGTEVTLNEKNNWRATVDDLPKYKDGQEIEYTWEEAEMPEGYTLTGTTVEGTITTLTNRHAPETTKATIQKVWDDAENQDGKRPENLTVVLSDGTEVTLNEGNNWKATVDNLPKYADGEEIAYTWTEGVVPEGYTLTDTSTDGKVTTLTNSYTPELTEATVKKVWNDNENADGNRPETLTVTLSNGEQVTLSAANNWTATVDNLPKYADGEEIAYIWTEGEMPTGYALTDTSVDGTITTLTNGYTPELTSATVIKVWDDNNNNDGKRPENLKVTLSNGTEVTLNEANNWTATVENLPKYLNGEEVLYTWSEEKLPEGYALQNVSVEGTITTITNIYPVDEKTEATVVKVWDDADNNDGKRPDNLKVTLSNGAEVVLNEANNWTATIGDLPKYKDGQEIPYTWTENQLPEGYVLTDTSVNGSITTLTNSHTPETTEATVKKVWDDADNNDGKRPESLDVTLSNGTEVTLNEANNWTVTVNNLPKYADGEEIVYSWMEGDMPKGYTLTDVSVDGTITTLTNSMAPEKTSISGSKTWEDNNDKDGKRPDVITISLLADGKVVETREVTAADNWSWNFLNLDKYADGKEIKYTIEEEPVEGYETIVDGYNITNKYVPTDNPGGPGPGGPDDSIKTGDNAEILQTLVALWFSLVAMFAVALKKRLHKR